MCKNRLEESYKNIKNRTKKAVANSMKKEAEKDLTKLNEKPNNIFILVKFVNKTERDVEGGRCMREKEKKRIWKNHMGEIMNKENDWEHVTVPSMVEGPIKNLTREEMAIAIKVMKPGKAAGHSEVRVCMCSMYVQYVSYVQR